jgi:hypothetical protein
MAQNYTELQVHLDRVRWAWKRAAALQGLAAVVIEALGMFLLFVLLDYIYVMPQTLRVATLALMGAVLAFLFVRHVVRPLLRVISDDQIAMYIEERQLDTEGALLTATSVGRESSGNATPVHDFIVANIVQSAVSKAGAIQLSRVLNLAKLRKYGIAALIVLLFFGISALRYSSFFSHQAGRLLMPWHMTDEDLKASGALVDDGPKLTFDLTLNPATNRILRGTVLKVKAKLSALPQADVVLNFRTKGAVTFQKLHMDEVDEINTYALRLPDVNDDLEIFVQSGTHRSSDVVVSVYDPLEVKGYEVTLIPPAYTKQPATTEFGTGGDITALEGTKVKFRAVANTALSTGELIFDDGAKVKLTGETSGEKGAIGEFTVVKDGTYNVRLVSADDQKSEPSSNFSIKATKDEPPSVAVESPGSDLSTHPDAEVEFRAKVADDVGIASADLIYYTTGAGAEDKTVRIPLKLDGGSGPGDHPGFALLALPDIKPALVPGSMLFYHIEVRDLKGQPAISDIYTIKLRPYEIAGAFPTLVSHPHPHPPTQDLMIYVAAAWNIHSQKELIEKAEYDRRCEDLAGRMVNPDGSLKPFKMPKASLVAPDKVHFIAEGIALVKKGVAVLKGHDAGDAVAQFREALALWSNCGVGLDMQDKAESNEMGEKSEGQIDPMKDALGFLKMDVPKKDIFSPKYDVTLPGYKRAIKPETAKEISDKAKELQKKEQQLLEEAKKLAMLKVDNQNQNPAEPKEEKPGEKKDDNTAEEKKPGEEKPGEPKTAEQKPGEQRPGEQKPGEQKPGEQKPGEQKPGAAGAPGEPKPGEKPGEAKPGAPNAAQPKNGEGKPNEGQAADAPQPPENGDQTADRNERMADLQRRQQALANESRKLEQQIAANANNADKNTKEVIEHFRASTRQMDAAVAQMKDGNLQQAAARGEEAKRELHAAVDKLQVSQFDTLDKAVAAADERAGQIAEEQKHIQDSTKKVVDDAQARNAKAANPANPAAPPGDPKLNAQDIQKLQSLAKLQVENQKNADNLEKYVGELEKWADEMHKKETVDELRKAARVMKQDNLSSTMVTAAVNLGQHEIEDAKDTQNKLDKTLNKLTTALQSANGSLAQTSEQKLKRAINDAKEIAAKAEKLAGQTGDDKDKHDQANAGANKPQEGKADGEKNKEGEKTADGGKADGEKNKEGEKPGDKTADAGKPQDGKADGDKNKEGQKPDDKTADAKNPDGDKHGDNADKGDKHADAANTGDKGDKADKGEKTAQNNPPAAGKGEKGPNKELTAEERQQLQAELYRDSVRLAKRIDQDKLSDAKMKGPLETITSEKSFEEMFKEGQKTKLDRYLGSLKVVSSHMEDKLDSLLKAKRLSAAQREQTPAQYRDMVNKYYEQLAKE